MEKARLKEESLVLVFWFCLHSEIFTGDDLQHFVLIKKWKKNSSFYPTETLWDQSKTTKSIKVYFFKKAPWFFLQTILKISS